jgi:hypothetical protein
MLPRAVRAQTAKLPTWLTLTRDEGACCWTSRCGWSCRAGIEDALQRGVPLYFVARHAVRATAGTGATSASPACSAAGGWPSSR